MKKTYVIFLAAGSGTRFGGEIPKQFVDLCGRPVLQQTMLKFLYARPEIEPVVVLPAEYIESWKKICKETHFDQPQIIVEGGITRFHSVRNALKFIPDGVTVAVHDAVRPLAGADFIKRCLDLADTGAFVVPVVPTIETLKSLARQSDGTFVATGAPDPDRSKVWRAQTPQIFPSAALKDAYAAGYSDSFTDDASVLSAKGYPLHYIEGEKLNFKITTKEDLDLARIIFEG